MSQLPYAYNERLTEFLTASSSYVAAGTPTIAAADLTPGRKYFVLARAEIHKGNIGGTAGGIRFLHGATAFDGGEVIYTQISTSNANANGWFTYFVVWTAVAGEDLIFQVKGDGTNSMGYRWASIVALPLGSDLGLTENVDWFYNEDNTDVVLTTGDQNGAAVTFTPGVASQDWAILSLSNVDSDTANTDFFASKLVRTGAVSASFDAQILGRNASQKYMVTHMLTPTLTAASHTFTEASRRVGTTAATARRLHSGIFALRLNAFDVHAIDTTDAKLDLTAASNYGTQLATVAPTQLVNNGAALVLASFLYEATSDTVLRYVMGRVQNEGTDEFSTDDVTPDYTNAAYRFYYPGSGVAGQHVPYLHMSVRPAVAAGAVSQDLDGSVSAASAGRGAKFRRLLYLSLDVVPPSAPGTTLASPRKNEQIMYQSDYSPNRRRLIIGPLVDATDGVTPEAGETGGVPQISKNGGAYANAPGLVAIDASKGTYYSPLSAANQDSLGSLTARYKSAATAEFGPITVPVEECPWVWDGPVASAGANTVTLGTGDVAPPTLVQPGSVIRIVSGTGAGQAALVGSYANPVVTLEAGVNWITNPDATSKVVIQPGLPLVVPDVNVKQIDSSPSAATGLKEGAEAITTFLIVSGTNTVTLISTDLPTTVGGSATNLDQWKGRGILGKSGRNLGDEAEITGVANVGGVIQLTVATLAFAPAVGTKFVMT